MHCDLEQNELARKFFEKFSTKARQRRIPVNGVVELTARCNLNCKHCYLSNDARRKSNNKEKTGKNIPHIKV